jgi:hypothetical protein
MLLNARPSADEERVSLKGIWPWLASLAPVGVYLALRAIATADPNRDTTLLGHAQLALEPFLLGPGLTLVTSLVPIPRGAHAFVSATTWWALAAAAVMWLATVGGITVSLVKRRWPNHGVSGLTMAMILLLPSLLAVSFIEEQWRFPIRYFHLPLAGVLIAAAHFVGRIRNRLNLVMPAGVVFLALLSFVRISDWHDERSFFTAEVEARPHSTFALSNLAEVLCEQGAYDEAEAIADRFDSLPTSRDRESEARIRLTRAKIDVLRDGNIEAATSRLEDSLRATPSDLTTLLTLTEIWAIGGFPDRSLRLVDRALESPHFRDHRRPVLEQYARRYRDVVRRGD